MSKLTTCSKTYRDLPFAHRQHRHDGHCSLIHGHNWEFRFTFACAERDEAGFIVDFGKLGVLKEWINDRFDHTLILADDDPLLEEDYIYTIASVVAIPDTSCEGLAEFLLDRVDQMVRTLSMDRAWVQSVEVREDSKNSALLARTT